MAKFRDVKKPLGFEAPVPSSKKPAVFTTGVPVEDSDDLQRILALKRRDVLDLESPRAEALADFITAKYAVPREPGTCTCKTIDPSITSCITRLLPMQAWFLHEIGLANGALGACAVGSGKTIVDLLAIFALQAEDSSSGNRVVTGPCQLALLLVPPSLIDQLVIDYKLLREHFRVPSLVVHGAAADLQGTFNEPDAPTLHVLAYSRLSLPSSSDWIDQFPFEAIISDECDRLKEPQGAAVSRLLRFYGNHGDCRFVGMTGSLTNASLSEFAHLSALALRELSPMPLDPDVSEDWGRCLDAIESPAPAGALEAFCLPGEDPDTEAVRRGFFRRFSETLGIIIAGSGKVVVEGGTKEVELVIRERPAPKLPPKIEEALAKVRAGLRPDTLVGSEYDEELVDALQQSKCAHEVATGVFYRWKFPPINGVPQKREFIKEWYKARKDWNCELRLKLLARAEWLDSPNLCERAAMRAWGDAPPDRNRPAWKAKHWPRWRDIKDKVEWEVEALRVDDYLARDAATWALENRGIVWYSIVEFGQWVSELSGEISGGACLPLHGGGPKAGELIRAETGDRSIIASLKSHGRGRNGLQRLFSNQLVANIPSSATMWEQLLGRMHRRGQKADTVWTWFYMHIPELEKTIEQALRRANYVEGTLGASQKLNMGYVTEMVANDAELEGKIDLATKVRLSFFKK